LASLCIGRFLNGEQIALPFLSGQNFSSVFARFRIRGVGQPTSVFHLPGFRSTRVRNRNPLFVCGWEIVCLCAREFCEQVRVNFTLTIVIFAWFSIGQRFLIRFYFIFRCHSMQWKRLLCTISTHQSG